MKIVLFKENKNGKVQQWSVEVENDKHRTIEGYVDGKLTTSEWTVCQSKNVGKKHETTPEQQALNEANSKATKKREQGYYDDIEDCAKGKQFIEPMLAHKFQDYGEKITSENETFCQPKLDGIRCIATIDGLFSRTGKPILAAPHIHESAKVILSSNPQIIALDGELYNHDLKHDFNKITSLVKKTKCTEKDFEDSEQMLQYHVYDAIVLDAPFADRLALIRRYDSFPYIYIVDTMKVEDTESMDTTYARYLELGYEGQMIRIANSKYEFGRTKSLLKRKEFQDEECLLLDVIEGNGNRSGMAGNVRCQHPNGNIFDANMRGGNEFYKELLINREHNIGKYVTVRYQNLTPDGNPRFPVMICFRDYE